MNKIIREVGFLALGLAALFETVVYWKFGWMPLVVLAIGGYFAIDGMAWGRLKETCCSAGEGAEGELKQLQEYMTPWWWHDFAALLAGTVSLGAAVNALRILSESHPGAIGPQLTVAACSLGVHFLIASSYWRRLHRVRFTKLREQMGKVWGPGAENGRSFEVFLLVVGISCIAMAAGSVGDVVPVANWLLIALILLLGLNALYLTILIRARCSSRST